MYVKGFRLKFASYGKFGSKWFRGSVPLLPPASSPPAPAPAPLAASPAPPTPASLAIQFSKVREARQGEVHQGDFTAD